MGQIKKTYFLLFLLLLSAASLRAQIIASGGGPGAFTIANYPGNFQTYYDGFSVIYRSNGICSASPTMDIAGKGPKTIVNLTGGALIAGDIQIDQVVTLVFDLANNNFRMISPSGNAGGVVAGIGTLNFIPKFTPNGSTLGNSTIFEDATGNVGIGTTTPLSALHIVNTTALNPRNIINDQYSNNVGGAVLTLRKSRGTPGSPSAVLSSDRLGVISFWGYNGSSFVSSAAIRAEIEENWSGSALGTALLFSNTAIGSTTELERMRIDNAGNVGIGITVPTAKLHVLSSLPATLMNCLSDYAPALSANQATDLTSQWNQFTANSTFNFSATVLGSVNRILVSAGQTGTVALGIGSQSDLSHFGSGTVSVAMGTRSGVTNYSTGSITDARGVESDVTNSGGGTITNGYGILVGGIQATNKWSIYATDPTAQSYFAGNVGIATPSPGFKLQIDGASASGTGGNSIADGLTIRSTNTVNGLQLMHGISTAFIGLNTDALGSGALGIGTKGGFPIHFYTNSGLTNGIATSAGIRMTILSSGNVGIGTSVPDYLLDVNGGFFHTSYNTPSLPASTALGGLAVGWNRSVGLAEVNFYNVFNSAPVAFQFSQKTGVATSTDLVTMLGNGAVGIGTTNPLGTLHLAYGSPSLLIQRYNDTQADDIIFLGSAAPLDATRWQISARGTAGVGPVNGFDIANYTGGVFTPRIAIDVNGNVGIGTSTPAVTLDISSTNAVQLPNGTTAQRPAAANGMFRYNNSNSNLEFYNGSWQALAMGLNYWQTAGSGIVNLSAYTGVSINTTAIAPVASAMLDITSGNKGLLIPRVSLLSNVDVATIAAPATSLLVYNTNAGMTNGALGFWYYDGTKWVPFLIPGASSNAAWSVLGNTGTAAGTNFVGTNDGIDLVFRTNNIERFRLSSAAYQLLGNSSGAAGLPVYSFSADANTGIYNAAVDQLNFTTGGSERFRITSAGQMQSAKFPAAATPDYSFTGNTGSGMLSPGINDLSFATNGTERLKITNAGQMQSTKFPAAATPDYSFTGNTGSGMLSPGINDLSFATNGTERLKITNAGQMQSTKFPAAATPDYSFSANTGSGMFSPGINDLSFATNGTERLKITNAGQMQSTKAPAAATPDYSFTGSTGTGMYNPAANQLGLTSAGNERIRVDAAGNVGIGTLTPVFQLDVVKDARIGYEGNSDTIQIVPTEFMAGPGASGAHGRYYGNGTNYGVSPAGGNDVLTCNINIPVGYKVDGFRVNVVGGAPLATAYSTDLNNGTRTLLQAGSTNANVVLAASMRYTGVNYFAIETGIISNGTFIVGGYVFISRIP